jgi:hypothetical protein
LRSGCALLVGAAAVRFGRSLARLDDERLRGLLGWFEASPMELLRRLGRVSGMLARYAVYQGEETWNGVGYDGPWLGRVEVVADPPPDLGPLP